MQLGYSASAQMSILKCSSFDMHQIQIKPQYKLIPSSAGSITILVYIIRYLGNED